MQKTFFMYFLQHRWEKFTECVKLITYNFCGLIVSHLTQILLAHDCS